MPSVSHGVVLYCDWLSSVTYLLVRENGAHRFADEGMLHLSNQHECFSRGAPLELFRESKIYIYKILTKKLQSPMVDENEKKMCPKVS